MYVAKKKTCSDFCDYYKLKQKEFPLFIKNLLVSLEDKRFYHHKGYDLIAILRSFFQNIKYKKRTYGGSTITQQLAKNLFLSEKKHYKRKIKEMLIAIKIEKHYTKDEIISLYLNVVNFGIKNTGIVNAAKYYYHKNIENISFFEALCLLSLLPSPTLRNPKKHPENFFKGKTAALSVIKKHGLLTENDKKAFDKMSYLDNNTVLENKYRRIFENEHF